MEVFLLNQIIIKGLKVYAYHGVNPEEKMNGQNFELDIILNTDFQLASDTDNISDTVSYADVVKKTIAVMQKQPYNLIEKAALVVADEILNSFQKIKSIDLTLKKPEAPVNADFSYMAVKIYKDRNDNHE